LPEHAGAQDDFHALQEALRLFEHPHKVFPLDLVHHAAAPSSRPGFSLTIVERERGAEDGRAPRLLEHQRHFSEHVSGAAGETKNKSSQSCCGALFLAVVERYFSHPILSMGMEDGCVRRIKNATAAAVPFTWAADIINPLGAISVCCRAKNRALEYKLFEKSRQ